MIPILNVETVSYHQVSPALNAKPPIPHPVQLDMSMDEPRS